MLGFSYPLGDKPVGYVEGIEPKNVFARIIMSSHDAAQYLVEIDVFSGGDIRLGARSMLGDMPLGAASIGDVPYAGQGSGNLAKLLYGDFHWIGAPTDAEKPNVAYDGRVSIPLSISRQMPISPEADRRVQRQFGEIEIANGDGSMDSIVRNNAVDGRRVRILYGPMMGSYTDFGVIADVLGVTWQADEERVRLVVRDRTYSLEKPLQTNLYDGAGGAGGTIEIKGKPKPLMFGRCRNVTPVLIDPTNRIYQVHDGKAKAVDMVYDRGTSITFDAVAGDAASYGALVSLSVTAGQFATCLDEGMFKLGDDPAGLVTADCRGSADPDYIDTFDTIALRLILSFAGIGEEYVNAGSFASAATIGGEMGIYLDINELVSTEAVLNRLAHATGSWWGTGRDGRITAGRLKSPAGESPVFYFRADHIIRLSVISSPIPRYSQVVGYKKNWTVQRGEDLAGAVLDRRQELAEPYKASAISDIQIKVRHQEALDPPVLETIYESQTDADALRDEKFNLHKVDRQMFELTCKRLGFLFTLGQIVNVTYPRFGLDSGKNFVVTNITENARGDETILQVWG